MTTRPPYPPRDLCERVLADVREVLARHGVVLNGTCRHLRTDGEIAIEWSDVFPAEPFRTTPQRGIDGMSVVDVGLILPAAADGGSVTPSDTPAPAPAIDLAAMGKVVAVERSDLMNRFCRAFPPLGKLVTDALARGMTPTLAADTPPGAALAFSLDPDGTVTPLALPRAQCHARDSIKPMGKILDRLEAERVLTVKQETHGTAGTFLFAEDCDRYFALELTRDEVRQLAAELIDIANNAPEIPREAPPAGQSKPATPDRDIAFRVGADGRVSSRMLRDLIVGGEIPDPRGRLVPSVIERVIDEHGIHDVCIALLTCPDGMQCDVRFEWDPRDNQWHENGIRPHRSA